MPYEGQYASKTAHSDVVRNPDVRKFLEECEPLREPSDAGAETLIKQFIDPPAYDQNPDISFVIASDGSYYTSSIDHRLPSIKVCYLKFSTLLIEMHHFRGLKDTKTNLIDPFRVAALQRNKDTLSLVLPLSNFRLPDDNSVRETFRRQLDTFLRSKATRFRENDLDTSLMGTLVELAQLRTNADAPPNCITVHRCPQQDCEEHNIHLNPKKDNYSCPACRRPLYLSDCLRVWEQVNDFYPNQEPASRFMSYIEHLLPIHYLRFLRDEAPVQLGQLAILVDGPLAVFGQAAWLHQCIMRFLYQLREVQEDRGYKKPVIIGLQKGGYLVEYMRLLNGHIPANKLLSITDEFRYEYLGVERSKNGFGSETYYGHDFAFKTPSGRLFVFSLPYPFAVKSRAKFPVAKTKVELYSELPRALSLITEVETDLYKNAVVPIALAHRYTAISLRPGGRVLDVMGRVGR